MLPHLNHRQTRRSGGLTLGSGSMMQGRGPRGLPVWVLALAGVLAILALLFIIVVLTMGVAPMPAEVIQPLGGV